MEYSISYWCTSHTGNSRSINQDNFICNGRFMELHHKNTEVPLCGIRSSRDVSLFGIFDGMGGEEYGEVASYIAAKHASVLEIGTDVVSGLWRFCEITNRDICKCAQEKHVQAMGTTAAVLIFSNAGVTLCNVGDTKIFLFCGDAFEQISKDHTAAAAFGAKPPLSQNLGIPPDELILEPYFAQGTYHDGDVYLICSDGLTDMVTSKQIVDILISKSIEDVHEELLKKALANGGRDNISIIICKIERIIGGHRIRKHRTSKGRQINGT